MSGRIRLAVSWPADNRKIGPNCAFSDKMSNNVLLKASFYLHKSKRFNFSMSVSEKLVLAVITINNILTCLQLNTCKVRTAVIRGSDRIMTSRIRLKKFLSVTLTDWITVTCFLNRPCSDRLTVPHLTDPLESLRRWLHILSLWPHKKLLLDWSLI